MNSQVNVRLLEKIPEEIIINNIIPFTYNLQQRKLLRDIRSFSSDFSIVENAYAYDYNYDILIYDLLNFCNNSRIGLRNMNNNFAILLNRIFKLRHYSYKKLDKFVFNVFRRDLIINPMRKLRFLWGILMPIERTRFINQYVLNDDH